MESYALIAIILAVLIILFRQIRLRSSRKSHHSDMDIIEAAINLPQQPGDDRHDEPATESMLRALEKKGVRLDRPLTRGQAMNVLGLHLPPDGRQVDILKHFNIPYSFGMNRTLANSLIQEIFHNPDNVKEWSNRPPTTRVRQGLLFMGGQLVNGVTQVEAQARLVHLGMEDPYRYHEWKQIDRLFLETNSPDIRAKYGARKITWKRFFEIYEALKSDGLQSQEMNGGQIIEYTFSRELDGVGQADGPHTMEPATV
ncbi:MAG: hypothetical protein KZQ95_01135 [Candidatus Thiodiazotropha sp. (ex Epidulcina cf. delphinae)]|nr:hypothetical protein [Candidatus Thiodiazotropha sp. (ex Epidulcina cf. delphinae)]